MSWFKCFIHGKNFPGELVGQNKPVGFFATRFVEAESPEAAEMKALSILQQDSRLALPSGVEPSTEARVYFEEIIEIAATDVPARNTGFTFYAVGDEAAEPQENGG